VVKIPDGHNVDVCGSTRNSGGDPGFEGIGYYDPFGFITPHLPTIARCLPRRMTPKQYADAGSAFAADLAYHPVVVSPGMLGRPGSVEIAGLAMLASGFRRGGRLDAQQGEVGPVPTAYGNYTYGVFMQSAGISLDSALLAASSYGLYQSVSSGAYKGVAKGGPLGTIPRENVNNIIDGFNAAQAGDLACP
jgi:hypothetical protein